MLSVDALLRSASVSSRAHRTIGLAAAALLTLANAGGVAAGVPPTVVECGQIVAYTAPDAAGPTDGSLTIGMLAPWTINADAVVGSSAASVLPSFAGTGPSCVSLALDVDGDVTALGFAPSGSISGDVVFDGGSGWYLFDDRLLIPTFITDAYPELAAIFVTSEAEGTPIHATFTVDVSTGGFTAVQASARFCGDADLDGDGNGIVGDAVIPAAVLDADSISDLQKANGRLRCADVETEGTVGQALELTTTVNIYGRGPAPDPPDTATGTASQPGSFAQDIVGLLAALFIAGVARLAVPAPSRRVVEEPQPAD